MIRLTHLGLCGLIVSLFCPVRASAQLGGTGWKPFPVTFSVQSPTNVPQNERYSITNNCYHCLLYDSDGAFELGNKTLARTEQRFKPDYTSGEVQYQALLMVPSNENSFCVFQIHTGNDQSRTFGATTFMAFWFTNGNGSLRDYDRTILATNLGNRWFQLNVDHNLVNRTIKVWVDKRLVWTQQDNGARDFYMKDGIYKQKHSPTHRMDAYISDILMWTNSDLLAAPLKAGGHADGRSSVVIAPASTSAGG